MPFDYTTGSPDNLTGGGPARMQDIQGPFYDIRAYLNTAIGSGSSGGSTPVLATAGILDVGVQGQIRAGRQLTVADFTSLGLTQPVGLWNLSDLTNLGSDAQALANKGSVTFAAGINGFSTTAAQFTGSTAQALYIAGASAGNYNIRTGSWGCWFRTAKRATYNALIGKYGAATALQSFWLQVDTNSVLVCQVWDGTISPVVVGTSVVADDRWHFGVVTHDGTLMRLYLDGLLEASTSANPLFAGSGPLNIGALAADSGTAATNPSFGRVDEAFVTNDILTEDQIRCLYAAKLTHTLGVTPTAVRVNVHRRRKGPAFVVTDFTTQPLRLHNFTAASLGDEGSNGQALTNNGTALSVAAADGAPGGAFSFAGAQSLSATDAGLPNLLTTRSYGCWFKTSTVAAMSVLTWGTLGTADARLLTNATGQALTQSGADVATGSFVADGQWHFAVGVEDNAAGDQVRRKLYLDGRLVAGSTVLNTLTLVGANRFRLGANPDGTGLFTGQIDGAFVTGYAIGQDEILRLYAKGSQDHGSSPKNPGDHVERVTASDVLFIGDTLDSQHTVDLSVVA